MVLPCTFRDYQRMVVQEDETTSMPRSLKIIMLNDLAETVKPGDIAIFNGKIKIEKNRRAKKVLKRAESLISTEEDDLRIMFEPMSVEKEDKKESHKDKVLRKN